MNLQELLKELRNLEFTDLINLYLEAKTGKQTKVKDLLPEEALKLMNSLEEIVKQQIELDKDKSKGMTSDQIEFLMQFPNYHRPWVSDALRQGRSKESIQEKADELDRSL